MNTVIMIGRLTRDPELRYIPNNKKAGLEKQDQIKKELWTIILFQCNIS